MMLYAKILKIIIYKNLKWFVNIFSRLKLFSFFKADSAIVYPAAAAFKLRLVVR